MTSLGVNGVGATIEEVLECRFQDLTLPSLSIVSPLTVEEKPFDQGGIAKIYAGRIDNRVVAVKFLNDPDHKRLRAEALIAFHMGNVCPEHFPAVFGISSDQGIVMEMIQKSQTLRSLLTLGPKAISCEVFDKIAQGILQAMSALEREGIVHHDIKLSNFLLEWGLDVVLQGCVQPTNVKCIDMGAALFAGFFIGINHNHTPGFAAPEIHHHTQNISDHRSDTFSAGVSLMAIMSRKTIPWRTLYPDINALYAQYQTAEGVAEEIYRQVEPQFDVSKPANEALLRKWCLITALALHPEIEKRPAATQLLAMATNKKIQNLTEPNHGVDSLASEIR